MMSVDTNNYESAAKDIEQEKKMVAALKRLSIGNMMSYDPDLPIEGMEFQFKQDDAKPFNNNGNNNANSDNTSPTSVTRERSLLSRKSSISRKHNSDNMNSTTDDNNNNEEFFDAEENDQILDTSNSLLWVPANLHPEVNPEQFKVHIKTTVEEIMERKLSRKSSLSRQSSLSSSSLPDDFSDNAQANDDNKEKKKEKFQQQKRFSNPSLRDLTNELEKLSKLAGMDSNDAITLARTLSTSSLGYTDVEKQAFDELSSPPHISPHHSPNKNKEFSMTDDTFVDPESLTSHKVYSHPQHQSQYAQSPQQHFRQQLSNIPQNSSTNDFALRRSRRLDYRKNSSPSSSSSSVSLGSNLQNNKHSKLVELRNSLNSSISQIITQQPHSKPKARTKNHQRKVRDSQLLFSYKNPNDFSDSSTTSLPSRGDSPYPTSASFHSPIEQQFNVNKFSQHNLTAKRMSHMKANFDSSHGSIQSHHHYPKNSVISEKDKSRPRQLPPNQPYTSSSKHNSSKRYHISHLRSQQPNDLLPIQNDSSIQGNSHVFKQNSNLSAHIPVPPKQKYQHSNPQLKEQKKLHQPYALTSTPQKSSNNKSNQLNENLNLLRFEINEFKESLSRNDLTSAKLDKPISNNIESPVTSDNNDSDFSFETTYQDISYEDSLGIEREVLQELNGEQQGYQNEYNDQDDTSADTRMLNVQKEEALTNLPSLIKSGTSSSKEAIFPNGKRTTSSEQEISSDRIISSKVENLLPERRNSSEKERVSSQQQKVLEDGLLFVTSEDQHTEHSQLRFQLSSSKHKDSQQSQETGPHQSLSHQKTEQTRTGNTKESNEVFNNFNESSYSSTNSVLKSHNQNAPNSGYNLRNDITNQQVDNRLKDGFEKSDEKRLESRLDNSTQRDVTNQTAKNTVENLLERSSINISNEMKKGFDSIQPMTDNGSSDQSSVEISPSKDIKKKSFGKLSNHSVTSLNSEEVNASPTRKVVKKKKSWPWLKERSASLSSVDVNNLPSVPESAQIPTRSFSTPEITSKVKDELSKLKTKNHEGKENMITKLFKKKKSHTSLNTPSVRTGESKDSGVTVEYESDSEGKSNKKPNAGVFKKKNKTKIIDKELKETNQEELDVRASAHSTRSRILEKGQSNKQGKRATDNSSKEFQLQLQYKDAKGSKQSMIGNEAEEVKEDPFIDNKVDKRETKSRKPKTQSAMTERSKEAKYGNIGVGNEKSDDVKEITRDEYEEQEEEKSLQSTLEIQEKLRKSIKRTSKANQPIEFTDSAFGFPLPPPSNSTLVMLDHRFPVHVERAIYRLSHLKLANPKRSLREQVLLSNFMYAYLNLVDHTLHLEQRLNNDKHQELKEGTEITADTEIDFGIDDDISLNEETENNESFTLDIDIDIANAEKSNIEV